MNEKKVCFISCINNAEQESRMIKNIGLLSVPEDYEIEFIGVTEVKSVCAGFNEAMESSDAKYKIYLSPDVEIRNINLVVDILKLFKQMNVGIIGTMGVCAMPSDMILQHGILYGPESNETIAVTEDYMEVLAVTGDLMATQYNIRWDEENCEDDYLYSVFQCAKYRDKGYKVIVPRQNNGAWISDSGIAKFDYKNDKTEKSRKYAVDNLARIFGVRGKKRYGILYFEEIAAEELIWPMVQGGYDFEIVELGISVFSKEEVERCRLVEYIREHHLDYIISINFSPLVSSACELCEIKYVSWVYDCPLQTLYNEQVRNSCNYIFSFDKVQVVKTRENGAKHVYYQPLATNALRSESIEITSNEFSEFSCDLSFIGSLYQDEIYKQIEEQLGNEARKDYRNVIDNAFGKWDGTDRIYHVLSESTLSEIKNIDISDAHVESNMSADDFYVGRLIGRALAYEERTKMLEILACYGIRLYTGNSNIKIDGVDIRPSLDYQTQLPIAYRLSRINIGITLHTITSGIPQRVFDILGAGGFLLTNYQPEIPELFKVGTEIEVYKDFNEMKEKVDYYLSHEDQRAKIAANGHRKVKEYYNYDRSLKEMFAKII